MDTDNPKQDNLECSNRNCSTDSIPNSNETIDDADDPFRPNNASIGWRNVRFETHHNGSIATIWPGTKAKVILNRLNGFFERHSLNAVMGPSGAGKSTLLNCLNGNQQSGLRPEVEIYLDKSDHGRVVSCCVEQHVERTIVGSMRVGQILRYAYRFKNGNQGDMERHIRKTIEELLLDERVLDRKFQQCSGGEQKRIAIAQELMFLQKPTLLFVDEPTTGLGSNAAHLVMKCLRQLATNHPMTIITSIHVPSNDILNLFDKLYVLARGGVCIYSGRPDQIGSFLETENLEIPENRQPIEQLIKLACNGISDKRVLALANLTLSAEYRAMEQSLQKLELYPGGIPNSSQRFSFYHLLLQTTRMWHITFVSQLWLFLFQLFICCYYPAFLITYYSEGFAKPNGCYLLRSPGNDDNEEIDDYNNNSSTNCPIQIQNNLIFRQNITFNGSCMVYFSLVMICVGAVSFGPFLRVFRNEYRNRWYSLGVFYWSKTLVTLVEVCLLTTVFALFAYFISGQHSVDQFQLNWTRIGLYLAFYMLQGILSQSVGQLIGTIFWNNLICSAIVSATAALTNVIFTGHFMDLEFSQSWIVLIIKLLLPSNTNFKAILGIFYGFGRCNSEKEYSLILANYHVDPDQLRNYAIEIARYVVVVRLVTLVCMQVRFNIAQFTPTKLFHFRRNGLEKVSNKELSIQYDIEVRQSQSNTEYHANVSTIIQTEPQIKSEEEIQFDKFIKNRISVAWQDLSLFGRKWIFEQRLTDLDSSDCATERNTILRNLNGEFRFGTLNALMGTSGAGKTSLLKVLNGQDKARLSAQTRFYLSRFTPIQTCFITQDVSGHLLPGITAKQILVYASQLKNSQLDQCRQDTVPIDHNQIAMNLLDELDLSDIVDTPTEKCSGGERKRLALALELTSLHMPNLICIDEPTSGLDSNSAEVVVACLRKLAQRHSVTIVASIHQPNNELLSMFDQIYVLARGGVCIYSGGPIGIVPRLSTLSLTSCPISTKFPIESLIKLSCCPLRDPDVHQLMLASQLQFTQTVVHSGLLSDQTQPVPDGIQYNRRRFSLTNTMTLCARYFAYFRGYFWMELLAYSLLYILYGFLMIQFYGPVVADASGCLDPDQDFNNSCSKSEDRIYEDNLVAYNVQYICLAFGFVLILVLVQTGLTFSRLSIYFFNEHRNGWYSTGSFYLCKVLCESAPMVVLMLLFTVICNIYETAIPGIGYRLICLMILAAFAYQSLAHIIGLIRKGDILLVILISVSIFITNMMLNNLFAPIDDSHYIYWALSELSIVRHLLDAIFILQYGRGRCLPKQFQPILYQLGLVDSDLYRAILSIVALMVIFHLIALSLMVYLANPLNQNRRHQLERITRYVEKLEPTNAIIPGLSSPVEHFRIKLIRF